MNWEQSDAVDAPLPRPSSVHTCRRHEANRLRTFGVQICYSLVVKGEQIKTEGSVRMYLTTTRKQSYSYGYNLCVGREHFITIGISHEFWKQSISIKIKLYLFFSFLLTYAFSYSYSSCKLGWHISAGKTGVCVIIHPFYVISVGSSLAINCLSKSTQFSARSNTQIFWNRLILKSIGLNKFQFLIIHNMYYCVKSVPTCETWLKNYFLVSREFPIM